MSAMHRELKLCLLTLALLFSTATNVVGSRDAKQLASTRGVCYYDASSGSLIYEQGASLPPATVPDGTFFCTLGVGSEETCSAAGVEASPAEAAPGICTCHPGRTLTTAGKCLPMEQTLHLEVAGAAAMPPREQNAAADAAVRTAPAGRQLQRGASITRVYVAPSAQSKNTVYCGTKYKNEKEQCVDLAKRVETRLRALGFTVYMNPDFSRKQKIRRANELRVDFYLSLHTNARGDASCKPGWGPYVEALVYDPHSSADLPAKYAQAFYSLLSSGPAKKTVKRCKKGYGYNDFPLDELTDTHAPSVIMELGFHDYAEDTKWFTENIDAMADKLASALQALK